VASVDPTGRNGHRHDGHPIIQPVGPGSGGRRGIGVGAFLLGIATAGAMAHVGVRMKGIEVAYDLGREKRINTELEEERRRLNIEIGMLKDPGRVVSIARDRLKMGPPAQADIVRLVPGQVLGAHVDAAPATKPTKQATRPQIKKTAAKPKPAVESKEAPVAAPADDEAREADE